MISTVRGTRTRRMWVGKLLRTAVLAAFLAPALEACDGNRLAATADEEPFPAEQVIVMEPIVITDDPVAMASAAGELPEEATAELSKEASCPPGERCE